MGQLQVVPPPLIGVSSRTLLRAFIFALVIGALMLDLVGGQAPVVSAEASANGKVKATIFNPKVLDATGIAIAAGKLYNPRQTRFRVSRQPSATDDGNHDANADEANKLEQVLDSSVGGIATAEQLAKMIKGNTEPTGKPERFKEVKKDFTNPDFKLLADIDMPPPPLANPAASEEAKARAILTSVQILGSRGFLPFAIAETKVVKRAASNPRSAAVAVNRDPVAIEWDPSAERKVTVDLSEVSLRVVTTGVITRAFALFGSDMSFRPNVVDVEGHHDGGIPLFDLLIAASSTDGGGPVLEAVESQAPGNRISDSLGNVGSRSVRDGLLSQLTVTGEGTLGFQSPYSFEVQVPGNSERGLLFLRDFAGASSTAQEIATPTATGTSTATRTSTPPATGTVSPTLTPTLMPTQTPGVTGTPVT
jgi:hypothetical protein